MKKLKLEDVEDEALKFAKLLYTTNYSDEGPWFCIEQFKLYLDADVRGFSPFPPKIEYVSESMMRKALRNLYTFGKLEQRKKKQVYQCSGYYKFYRIAQDIDEVNKN